MALTLDLAATEPAPASAEDRLFVVASKLPSGLENAPNVTLVRGKPYTLGCVNTLWTRGLRFERIVDANPDKTLRDCLLLAEEFPRLLAAGVGRMTLAHLDARHVPKILMAIHQEVRTCAWQEGSSVLVDMRRMRCAWIDVIGRDAGMPDPLARRALITWVLETRHAHFGGERLVVVDLAADRHFASCAIDVLDDRGLVLRTLSRPDLPVHVLWLGNGNEARERWDLRARQAMHFDGVVLSCEEITDMPSVGVVDLRIATQDLSFLRKIMEDISPDLVQS